MARKDKKKRSKKIWLIPVILLGAAGGMFYLKHQPGKEDQPVRGIEVVEAIEDDILITTKGSGAIEAAFKKAVSLDYDGKLEAIYVEPGDQVHVGDELALYDREALDAVIKTKETELTNLNQSITQESQYGNYYITTPISGNVKRVFASVGDSTEEVIQKYGGLVEIAADNKLKIEFTAEGYAPEQGKPVIVTFDYETVTGVVESSVGQEICVTIPDKYYYRVGTPAIVYTGNWERLGSGALEINMPYLVQAENGVISNCFVDINTIAYAGYPLFSYSGAVYNSSYMKLLEDREEHMEEIQSLQEYQNNSVVLSEYDGYVVSVEAMEGMSYKKDQQLCVIADSSTLYLKVDIDELDIDGVGIGMRANVVFDAFEDQTYEGTVEKISGVGKNSGGVTTYTVTIALPGDAHIRDAMSATAEIVMKETKGAVLVPIDAVIAEDDKRYVQIVQGEDLYKTEVQTGLVNDDYIEILDGISVGTKVAIEQVLPPQGFIDSMMDSGSLSFREREAKEKG